MTINGTSGLVFNDASTQNTAAKVGMVNRIINGAMVIDQRNAGASVSTASGVAAFCVDRWVGFYSTTNKYTMQQNAGSVTPPSGFRNYLGVTSSAATSLSAGDYYLLNQRIEGFNVADLMWGTANAAPVTLSFWVRSSLTGTFGGSINPTGDVRSYVFSYSIPVANTWTQISVTIAGDTTGTWNTTNLVGMSIYWGLGVASNLSTTTGSWVSGSFYSATGATSVVGTNGATFYITGVQLEKGSTATSFDYRPYGTELALCQRYLPAWILKSSTAEYGFSGMAYNSTTALIMLPFMVQARTRPTGITISNATHFQVLNSAASPITSTNVTYNQASLYGIMVATTVASGLTAGNATIMGGSNTSSLIYGTGCEL
jgi:hypothetical protein